MKLNLSIEDKDDIERFIAILNLGVIDAIKNNLLSIQQATNYFLSPYTAQSFEEIGVGTSLIDLILLGCELEDVERLVPNKFSNSLNDYRNRTIKILKDIPNVDLPTKYWVEE